MTGPTVAGCSVDSTSHTVVVRFNKTLLRGDAVVITRVQTPIPPGTDVAEVVAPNPKPPVTTSPTPVGESLSSLSRMDDSMPGRVGQSPPTSRALSLARARSLRMCQPQRVRCPALSSNINLSCRLFFSRLNQPQAPRIEAVVDSSLMHVCTGDVADCGCLSWKSLGHTRAPYANFERFLGPFRNFSRTLPALVRSHPPCDVCSTFKPTHRACRMLVGAYNLTLCPASRLQTATDWPMGLRDPRRRGASPREPDEPA